MDLSSKRIGIWGFGIVGKSVANYLCRNGDHPAVPGEARSEAWEQALRQAQDKHPRVERIEVLEKRDLTDSEIVWLKERDISFFQQNIELENFLEHNDIIIPSPGIDLSQFTKYKNKFLSELDIFALNFKKPVIAITGTLGKTSTTHLLTKLFCMQGIRAVAAGNIGLGMCDLLYQQDGIDLVVLEVSSFQLERSNLLKPTISIWTNFYPNHLDWHKNIKSYFDAKFRIMLKQDSSDNALLPFSLINEVYFNRPHCKINFFTTKQVSESDFELLKQGDSLFYIHDGNIYKYYRGIHEFIYPLKDLPEISFIENWLIICATFNLYKDLPAIQASHKASPDAVVKSDSWVKLNLDTTKLDIPEHRLEKFAQLDSIEFYNDSKSTVGESTLAAVSKFKPDDLILFLGGLSKGVDRSILVNDLKNKVKTIICFGAEAEQLKTFCDLNSIPAFKSDTLEEAVNICMNIKHNNAKILFSPAGSSYDLFLNYQERGKVFKNLVNKCIDNN